MGIRDLGNRSAEYQSKLRNRQIDYNGLTATIYITSSTDEDEYDELGGRKTNFVRTSQSIQCLPSYDRYYQILNLVGGQSVDEDLPLEVEIRTDVDVPNNTILEIPINTKDNVNVLYKWRVLKTEYKHLEKVYTKRILVVPARG